jgi:dimethylamine/trimethylamine dehydrogenase
VTRLGDCLAPGLIAAAVYSGHQYARTYQEQVDKDRAPFMREDIARLYGLRSA